ncbi:MAG: response regulator [Phycisphaerales bacterium JB059]
MRTLIVDDSNTMRMIIASTLKKVGGHVIETASDGKDALAKIGTFKPDLILLDWNMPNMSGLEFLTAYRETGGKTPVIMVTTEAEKSRVIRAVQAGANNYLVKPFTADQLAKRVADTIAKFGQAA